MTSVTQQLPALIGVIIGASASFLITAATDRTRWRREQSSRWDEKRAQAYAEYAYAVKTLFVHSLRIANSRLGRALSDPIDYDEALAELRKLENERTAKWEMVLLVGNPETIEAARTWHRRVWYMDYFARGERSDPNDYKALLADVDADRTRFYEAAKQSLGITSGEVPRGGPWEAPPQAT